ncbi:hypothetical protein GCM10009557_67730 [Virgisporangium ochraceum]|uniref:SUKH-3 immunity protein n=1 Tax=Virgisporangium ochraceum TaxID=65505 RepID=A0A8J3ZPQ9_9ACTN|nr:SUKH-3 domain-containing protein [Virgisporangium ochraceum]GIJ66000.1 hypothetical protein Voc01_009170 [Virgisporangium ochraceum]
MISRADAAQAAQGHLRCAAADLGLAEYDDAFVVWREVPRDGRMPAVTGQPTVVVDRETGELTPWGSLPADVIARQYTAHRAARDRFPPDVRSVLETAGWWPARDRTAAVTAWLETPQVATALAGIDLSGPARTVLAEFGGLRLPQRGVVPPGGAAESPDGGFASRFFPIPDRVGADGLRSFTARTGIAAAPVGDHEDGPADLVIDGDGRVFLLHWAGDHLVANTVDEAVVWMVRGGPLQPLE